MAKEKEKELKDCFIISPIGESDSTTRKLSDKVLKHIITPPVTDLGYEPVRADQISEPGIITTQIIQKVVDSPLIIADLTGSNPNVLYELAVRHATKKPVIQIIKKGESIPFDIAASRVIYYDIHDLDSVEEAKEGISNQIKNINNKSGEIDNPISASLRLKGMLESDNPEQKAIVDMVAEVAVLRQSVLSIHKKLDQQESIRRFSAPSKLPELFTPFPIRDYWKSITKLNDEFEKVLKQFSLIIHADEKNILKIDLLEIHSTLGMIHSHIIGISNDIGGDMGVYVSP